MVKRGGRFSGEAFAVLPASTQMDFALAKNKTYMGKRYVEVFRAKKLVSTLGTAQEALLSVLLACMRWQLLCGWAWHGLWVAQHDQKGRERCRITIRRSPST